MESFDKYIEQLKPVFAEVAVKIGQGAEFGWTVVMKQQMIEAVFSIGFVIFFGVLLLATYKLNRWAYNMWGKSLRYDRDSYMVVVVISTIVGVGLFFGALYNLTDAIAHLVNPEYYTLKFFIDLARPAVEK